MSKISSTIFTGLVFFIHFCSADSFQCFATPLKEEKLDHQTILFSGDTNLSLAEKMANYLGT
ncbi:MAG: hypothetical protein JSS09_05845, partial [Verrucomicrobia bacterium]|nr:hypothetical protein [Verrucomicrobiota bacterium]